MQKKLICALLGLGLAAPLAWSQTVSPTAPATASPPVPAAAEPTAPASKEAPRVPGASPPALRSIPPAALPDIPSTAPPPSELTAELLYQLLVGEITAQEGEPGAGYALMLDAARKTGDQQLYQRATEMALQGRSGDAALQAATAWRQAHPESRDANRFILQILIALNRISDTAGPLRTEIELAPAPQQPLVIEAIPRAYARVSDKKAASAVVDEALASYRAKPATAGAAWTSTGRMRLAAGDTAGALDAARKGQAADPTSAGPALIALGLMDDKPNSPEAEALVKKYLETNPATGPVMPEIRMGYARALIDAQRYAESTTQLQFVTRERPEFAQAWLVMGSLQLQDNQLPAAQTSLMRYISLAEAQPADEERSRGMAQAYLSLSQIAEKRKDFTAAENWIKKINNPEVLIQAQTRRASILASQGKLQEARELIRNLPENSPADARQKLLAEVSLLREVKQYKLAYELMGDVIAKNPQEPELKYDQAMLAEKMGDLPGMERLLREVIAVKPDYFHAYNALGYSLADRNVRLPEARELIRKALEFTPADPFIQDSLGWVEFRMGNRAEASRIFEAAYKAKPDAEIAAHYGEVLWASGQRDKALSIWREGMLINPENETLLETLKRLQVKL
ncbi:MAG: tetratricopeptide repeat protein [Comamonadaceae bacterium]|nr:MAG: tetratricopeptide repeat protein [Comamonadaceae bacterium]